MWNKKHTAQRRGSKQTESCKEYEITKTNKISLKIRGTNMIFFFWGFKIHI